MAHGAGASAVRSEGEYRKGIGKIGIKARKIDEHGNVAKGGQPTHFVVANFHQALARIYEPTRWAQGGWKQVLERVEGALYGPAMPTVNFGGGAFSRGVWLPATLLFRQDARDAGDGEVAPWLEPGARSPNPLEEDS